ncbi:MULTISPECIES: Do family serine endopeptidase [Aureimonas]|uniref:Do family serine endopeptidase n=1 Tax=Aureimonas TaxID=414371 RepID=UPI000733FC35|nr:MULTISPECIES: Do family serine endopeptidase [Aureimonas]
MTATHPRRPYRRLRAFAVLLSTVAISPLPAFAQGVIAPPSEGQPIAPQPPAAGTLNPDAAGVPPTPNAAQPRAQGPASVADLAERLLGAVVNISTSQTVDRGTADDEDDEDGDGDGNNGEDAPAAPAVPKLNAPDGSPLQKFFDDLLQGDSKDGTRKVQSLGSGFVIDPSGIIVTNNHVIADADEITVNFADGKQLDAKIVGVDTKTDIAVLKVEPEAPLAAVPFGDSEQVRIGDWVMAIGNPFGLGGSVTVGIVSARGRNINAGPYDNFIQTDAAINRGNSGGPLFDMYGRVIGINTAIISPTGGSIGIGFAIPAVLAQNVVAQLRDFGETRRGWLGLRLQEVSEEIAESLGLPSAAGALVMGVVPQGPSDTGKIEIGDVIRKFDGKPVATSRDLPRMVAESPVGKVVKLEILRKQSLDAPAVPVEVEVTLGRLEDGEAADNQTDQGEDAPDEDVVTEGPLLGLSFTDLSDESRKQFDLPAEAQGAVISAVEPNSASADKGLESGMTVREIGQEKVANGEEAREKLAKAKADGRKNALLLVADKAGDLRLVVVPID